LTGGLHVPILIVVFGFSFKGAARLSLCLVFGNTLTQIFLNRNATHPKDTTRPLPYWDLILIFLPAQLIGSTVGIILKDVIPSLILECISMTVLGYAVYKTFRKGLIAYASETTTTKGTVTTIDRNSLLPDHDSEFSKSNFTLNSTVKQPWTNFLGIGIIWSFYTAIFAALAFVDACSSAYVSLLVSVYIPLLLHEFWATRYVLKYASYFSYIFTL
jgi:uncharacterized membrane protein YfcA